MLTIAVGPGAQPDTAGALAQLQSYIEHWRTEGTDAVVIAGQAAVSKQYVLAVRRQMPKVTLVTDADASAKQG